MAFSQHPFVVANPSSDVAGRTESGVRERVLVLTQLARPFPQRPPARVVSTSSSEFRNLSLRRDVAMYCRGTVVYVLPAVCRPASSSLVPVPERRLKHVKRHHAEHPSWARRSRSSHLQSASCSRTIVILCALSDRCRCKHNGEAGRCGAERGRPDKLRLRRLAMPSSRSK